jgi:hypothetical protein
MVMIRSPLRHEAATCSADGVRYVQYVGGAAGDLDVGVTGLAVHSGVAREPAADSRGGKSIQWICGTGAGGFPGPEQLAVASPWAIW